MVDRKMMLPKKMRRYPRNYPGRLKKFKEKIHFPATIEENEIVANILPNRWDFYPRN